MMDTLKIASQIGLEVAVSIPFTHENVSQIEDLVNQLENYQTTRISCFVPHSEGRGRLLDKVRFTLDDYEQLSDKLKCHFNRNRFKPEMEWVQSDLLPQSTKRVLTVTLTPDNIEFFEDLDFNDTIAYLEKLDDTYYQIIPTFEELIGIYGDPDGTKMYSARDLYLHYQK